MPSPSQLLQCSALCFLVFSFATIVASLPSLELILDESSIEGNGFYSVVVNNKVWLQSGQMEGYFNHQWYTTNTTKATQEQPWNAIQLLSTATKDSLKDDFGGAYSATIYNWSANGLLFNTVFKVYDSHDAISFMQEFPNGMSGTNFIDATKIPHNCDNNSAVIPFLSFPSFLATTTAAVSDTPSLYASAELGYLTWHNTFAQPVTGKTPLVSQHISGISGGPVVLYDSSSAAAVVVSSNDHFSTSTHSNMGGVVIDGNHHGDADADANVNVDWRLGISAQVLSVPSGFEHETVVVVGAGINDVVLNQWSGKITAKYPTERAHGEKHDVLTSYLGYWTDNGAYYYAYNFGSNLSCCDTDVLTAVKQRLDAQGLRIHYWQMDDWWMPVTGLDGHLQWVGVGALVDWQPKQPYFAGGLSQLSYELQVPLALYGPYFSPSNIWINEFEFIPDPHTTNYSYVLPSNTDSYAFYAMLLDTGINSSTYHPQPTNTGMIMYEIDFMGCLSLTPEFRLHIGYEQQWLTTMNKAAQERDVTIQYCMSWPSNFLSSLTLSQVTNARASWDYASGPNWNIGITSLLLSALKLKPSKDNFWSTFPQPAPANVTFNPYGNDQSSCESMAVIAILSCGPIGISDRIGYTNATIVNRTVRSDGRLLQPHRPSTAVNDQFLMNVFDHEYINVWNTQSYSYSDSNFYQLLLALNMNDNYEVRFMSFYPMLDVQYSYVVHKFYNFTNCQNATKAIASNCVQFVEQALVASNRTLYTFVPQKAVKPSNESFELLTFIPTNADANELVLIGELDKYVSCSEYRFSNLVIDSSHSLSVDIIGGEHEIVKVSVLQPIMNENEYMLYTYDVDVGQNGNIHFNVQY